MKITHHLDEATILAHAAGTLGEAHGLAASAHIAFCNQCRSALREAEGLGGQIFEEQDVAAVSDACRAATLASLDAIAPAVAKPKPVHGELPVVIRNLLGTDQLDSLKWRYKAPGVSTFEIPLSSKGNRHLQLLRIGPGKKMPEHGHGGEELTVILRGAYSDHTGRYTAGDVADLDEDVEHQPKVDSDVDCICLVATEAPTRFRSFWARLAQPFLGI